MFKFSLVNFDINSILGLTKKYDVPKEQPKPSQIEAYKEMYVACHDYIAGFANIIDKLNTSPENTNVNCEKEFKIIRDRKNIIWQLFGYEHKLFSEQKYKNCKEEFIKYYEIFENTYLSAQTHNIFTDTEAIKILKSLKVSCDALWKLENMIEDL